jgi:hypothetical protein
VITGNWDEVPEETWQCRMALATCLTDESAARWLGGLFGGLWSQLPG